MAEHRANFTIYGRLNAGNREIRLIHLYPSDTDDDVVRIDLSTVSLDANPDYEAISYCWGEPTNTVDILVGSELLRITASLHGALRCLRSSDDVVVMWADAVCINQADLSERASQVRIMGDIYSNAAEVRVWLGEEDEQTELGLQTMGYMQDGIDCWTQTNRFREQYFPDMDDAQYYDFGIASAQAIFSVVSRPWFERLWVRFLRSQLDLWRWL